jgi:hypothetical protein
MGLMTWLAKLFGGARIGRVMWAIAAASAAAGAAGVWTGVQWERGRTAIGERTTLRADVVALVAAGRELRQYGAETAQDFRTAARRMDAVATGYQGHLDAIESSYLSQQAAIEAYAAARAGAVDCLGADGMRIWAAAAAGEHVAGPAGPTATDPGGTEAALSGAAAGTGGGHRDGDPARMDAGSAAVSPVPHAAGGTFGGGH